MRQLILVFLFLNSFGLFAGEFFASSSGDPSGTGSINSPWDLKTALSKTAEVGANDTLYVRGGRYFGRFDSHISGSEVGQVTIRPYQKEKVVIDGNITYNINSISGADTTITVYGADTRFLELNRIITIHSESGIESIKLGQQVSSKTSNGSSSIPDSATFTNCIRGYYNTTPMIHQFITGVYLANFPSLSVWGNYSTVRDLIFENTNKFRTVAFDGSISQYRGSGTTIYGHHTEYVNNIVKDNGVGVGFTKTATHSILYGNTIFNNGWSSSDRSHGHGIYTQNLPNQGKKILKQNIVYNNFRIGVNAYGSSVAHVVNYDFEENVFFNTNSAATFPDNPPGYDIDYREKNVLLGSGNPSEGIRFINNHFYHDINHNKGSNLYVGYTEFGNIDAEIIGNTIVGGKTGLTLIDWQNLTVRDNFIATAGNMLVVLKENLNPNPPILPAYDWDNNEYIKTDGVIQGLNIINIGTFPLFNPDPDINSWNEWTHFDGSSFYDSAPLAESFYEVFINQFKPEDEASSLLVVHNYALLNSMDINFDATHLQENDSFRVIDIQSGLPVYYGVRDSGQTSFALPIVDCGAIHPIGLEHTPYLDSNLPEFGVFRIENLSNQDCDFSSLWALWNQSNECISQNPISVIDLVKIINNYCN